MDYLNFYHNDSLIVMILIIILLKIIASCIIIKIDDFTQTKLYSLILSIYYLRIYISFLIKYSSIRIYIFATNNSTSFNYLDRLYCFSN